MAVTIRLASGVLLALTLLTVDATPAPASLFALTASGTISINTTSDATIPAGTPWSFTLTYDTAAPDLDAEGGGTPDPTFGRFANSASPPALVAFHYQAGSYDVTLNDPADFGAFSSVDITFLTVHAIDININAPTLFPPLAGGAVSFHADFNAFSKAPIFANDGLPTNTAITAESFDQSTVTLLPPAGIISGSVITSLSIAPVTAADADFDGDGDVDGDDLAHWQGGFGGNAAPLQGDADGDADVDGNDFLAWQRQLGSAPAAGAATAAPEPGALSLAVLTLVCLHSGCRKRGAS